jgi:hypothetical protein
MISDGRGGTVALDALWSVEFQAWDRSVNGGVIVLNNGRILGGDSSHYYLGTLTAHGTKVEGQLRIVWYTGSRETVWGDDAAVVDASATGEAGPGTIAGKMSRAGHQDISFRMTRRSNLS